MKQQTPIAKRAAASRKAWQTRKRMTAARSEPTEGQYAATRLEAERILSPERLRQLAMIGVIEPRVPDPASLRSADIDLDQKMPAYMRRALPCPDFGASR